MAENIPETPVKDQALLDAIEHLSSRIDKQNELLALTLRNQTSFKARVSAGLWTGLGTVLGATVLVSALVLMLRPLSKVDWISPIVNRVIDTLENRSGSPRPHRIERTESASNTPSSPSRTP